MHIYYIYYVPTLGEQIIIAALLLNIIVSVYAYLLHLLYTNTGRTAYYWCATSEYNCQCLSAYLLHLLYTNTGRTAVQHSKFIDHQYGVYSFPHILSYKPHIITTAQTTPFLLLINNLFHFKVLRPFANMKDYVHIMCGIRYTSINLKREMNKTSTPKFVFFVNNHNLVTNLLIKNIQH